MIDLHDPVEDQRRAGEDRRRLLVSFVGERLRTRSWPRLTMLVLLVLCFGGACLVDHWLAGLGIRIRAFRWLPAVLFSWPVFVLLLRWRAAAEWRKFDSDQVAHEMALHQEDQEPEIGTSGWRKRLRWDEVFDDDTGLSRPVMMNPFVFCLLGAVTLGGWLLWDLVRSGPTLIANCLIDAELVRSRSELAGQIPTENWWRGTLGATGIHIFGLMIAAFLLGMSWPLDYGH